MKAVIDRIENDMAVLLIGMDETKLDVPMHFLPNDVEEGSWLRIDFRVDEHTTKERYTHNKFLLERLKRKRNDGR